MRANESASFRELGREVGYRIVLLDEDDRSADIDASGDPLSSIPGFNKNASLLAFSACARAIMTIKNSVPATESEFNGACSGRECFKLLEKSKTR